MTDKYMPEMKIPVPSVFPYYKLNKISQLLKKAESIQESSSEEFGPGKSTTVQFIDPS